MSDNSNTARLVGWEADEINSAFSQSGIKFHQSNSDTLNAFKNNGEREVTFGEDGKAYAKYDAEILPLTDALTRWAADAADGICDRRTLPRSPGGGRKGIASKADLQTSKDKAAFIAEYGLKAFESLPTKSQPTSELRYQDDFRRLPLSEKTRLIKQYGTRFVENLPARPTGQPYGAFINREALKKIESIKGKSAR